MAVTILSICCVFCIFCLILAYPPPVYYLNDKMGAQEKIKICHLSKELLRDSLLKLRQIVDIRKEHDAKVSYNVGMIMGRIREKYRFMLETYRDTVVTYYNWSRQRPPSVKYFRPYHYVIALELMHYLELEIDKLVDVLIEEAADDIKHKRAIAGQEQEKLRQKRLRNATNTTTTSTTTTTTIPALRGRADRLMEEAEKSLIRQRYLMKKLGQPINMTTMKKRFLRQWPVEESWPLDKYNYNY